MEPELVILVRTPEGILYRLNETTVHPKQL